MTLAARLSAPLAPLDGAVNAIHDALNRVLPGLWWPLAPPSPAAPLGLRETALLAAHAGALGLAAAGLARDRRRAVLLGAAGVGAGTWLVFTGAWDRRAAA